MNASALASAPATISSVAGMWDNGTWAPSSIDITWVDSHTATELVLLLLAFALSAVIGAERQYRLRAAGLKTHTLVGIGAALFTLVSIYGFQGLEGGDGVDISRIAAQVVTGIGFIGAGVIFVRRGAVSGLTTAASIWVTAAIGMTCGVGMPLLAIAGTVLYLVTVGLVGLAARRLGPHAHDSELILEYREGAGALRGVLAKAADLGIEALVTATRSGAGAGSGVGSASGSGDDAGTGTGTATGHTPRREVAIRLINTPRATAEPLVHAVSELPGVLAVRLTDAEADAD